MFSKILIAVDKADISRYAFDQTLTLAKSTGAELCLLHVLNYTDPDSPDRLMLYSSSAQLNAKLIQQYEHDWNAYVAQYGDFLINLEAEAVAAGISVTHEQVYGNPGKRICEVAKDWQADLITLGSHHRSGLKRLLLGSVSNYVLHHAPCSVLVMQPKTSVSSANELSSQEVSVMSA